MKKYIATLIISITILASSFGQAIIDTATDVAFVQLGQSYKYHVFRQGESLLALAKVYKVPIDQIIAYNFFKGRKIKPGQGIKIPLITQEFEYRSLIDTVVCCLHKVKRKETLNSIAQDYNISPELILEFNPSIKEKGLRKRHYIRIPQIKPQEDIEDNFFIYHIARKGETSRLVALYYNIPIQDLMEFNKEENFKFGQIVVVPKKHYNPKETSILRADYLELPDLTGLDELQLIAPVNPPCRSYQYNPNSVFNVAVMLPLFINENEAQLNNAQGVDFFLYDRTNIFYRFIFGCFVAIDDLRQLGINVHIHIFDTRKDSIRVKNLLSKPQIKDMDLIIGPVYSYNYHIVKEFAYNYHINFISPLSRNEQILERNPFVFLVNPSERMLMQRIAQFIAPSADTVKIIIFTEYFKPDQKKDAQDLTDFLKKLAWETRAIDTIDISTMPYDPTEALDTSLLCHEKTNFIVIPSKNEVFVNGLLNQLNTIKNIYGYKITVIGMPNWENFRNFDLNWYLSLNIHYPSAFYIDKENYNVRHFRDKYLKNFNQLPDYYSYMGYDIMNYFIHALRQYGKTFQYCLSPTDMEPNPRGLFLNFDFKRMNPYSGFENNAVFMIYYDNNLNMRKIDNLNSLE